MRLSCDSHATLTSNAVTLPARLLWSTPRQAEYQALSLGLEACRRLFVQHPISDATPAEIVIKADGVYDEASADVTDGVAFS